MKDQNKQLSIGDKIGFVRLADGVDDGDKVTFFPVVEVTERDGERAYYYQYPDGEISRSAIRQSQIFNSHVIKIERVSPKMICLSERKAEFAEALLRAKNNRLEVYSDWDEDSFVVVNLDNKSEYRVRLESAAGKLYGGCDCGDFRYRKRVCKHLTEVLTYSLFGVNTNKDFQRSRSSSLKKISV